MNHVKPYTVASILAALDKTAETLASPSTDYAKGIRDYATHMAELIRKGDAGKSQPQPAKARRSLCLQGYGEI